MRDKTDLAQEKALQRITYEEMRKMEAEERAAQQKAEAEQAAIDAAMLLSEDEATRILSSLRPIYARRNEAAGALRAALMDFLAIQGEIKAGMMAAENVTRPYWQYLDNYLRTERREMVRRKSGLPANSDIQLPRDSAGDLAYCVLIGIASGYITSGGLKISSMMAPIKR